MSSLSPPDPESESALPTGKGRWKRRRRSLLKRLFRKTTIIAIVAIAGALAAFYYLVHHLNTHQDQD